ncbi:MAG: hypothetical protein OK439_00900 [Thaumarchaeota archaeon]|nr:hypothetical protein [Nitrososphaerota archaeon]
MVDLVTLYGVTTLSFVAVLILIWYTQLLSTGKMVLLLFTLDISLTIEAAFNSDVVLIALLHVVTIPAFFGLIYFDLVKQHNSDFRCFICGKAVQETEEIETVNRFQQGFRREVRVHSSCINLNQQQRKTFSKRAFRKGIPE